MNFLPASSLFLGLSTSASVRRPHRETWEHPEGTELDEVCERLRCKGSSSEAAAGSSVCAPPAAEEAGFPQRPPAAGSEAAANRQASAANSSRPDAASSQGEEDSGGPPPLPSAACSSPFREAADATAGAYPSRSSSSSSLLARQFAAAAGSSSSRECMHSPLVQRESAAALRRAFSTMPTSLPAAPYERLLFQRQQQRRLLQQQATLRSFPSLSSNGGNAEVLAAALHSRHQRQQQQQQQQQPQQQEQQEAEEVQREQEGEEAAAADRSLTPCRSAVVAAELKGPCLSPSLRLQLLKEAMWTAAASPNSSLGRSERKWWSMQNRNLEAFIGVPPAYRWRAWQAVCAYYREGQLQQEGGNGNTSSPSSFVYLEPADEVKLKEHLAALPDSVETAAFLEAFQGGHVCPKLYAALSKHKSSYFNLILIDVPRTFPELPAVDRDAQGMLFRILNAFANLHVEVGYCQGMNFVAGLLLLVSAFNEFEAFSFFCFLMTHQHLKEFFRERFPLLRKYIRAFDDLAVVHLPKLREHFIAEGVMAPVYLHQWFLTLFITSLPLRSALVVWDFLLAKGLHAVLQLAIALLLVLARFLIRLKFEEIVKFLKSLKCSGGVDDFRIGKMLVKQAAKIQVPSHLMKEISPRNLPAIIREAELEEEEESRSRNAAFIAAAAAVENPSSSASNPLVFVAGEKEEEEEEEEEEEDEGSLHKVVASNSTISATAKSSASSTPREKYEEMVLIRSSAQSAEDDAKASGVSTAKPWFAKRVNTNPISPRSPREEAVGSDLVAAAASLPASAAEQTPEAERMRACMHAKEEDSGGRRNITQTPLRESPGGVGAGSRLQSAEGGVRTPEEPPESDEEEEGYELVDISNAERAANPMLQRVASGGRLATADAVSCASSAFADDYEREVVREREGSFIDTITRLWLAGR
ncbi:hypothetical protein Efla_006775 [Eimeria flavescens]